MMRIPSMFLGVGSNPASWFWDRKVMCRIFGRLRSFSARENGVNLEIPILLFERGHLVQFDEFQFPREKAESCFLPLFFS